MRYVARMSCTLVMGEIHLFYYDHNFNNNFFCSFAGLYRGEIPKFWRAPTDHWPIATSAWLIFPNVGLAIMHLLLSIRTFLYPSPQCHTALSFPHPFLWRESSRLQMRAVSQRARKTLDIQIRISVLRRETHAIPTKKTWSEIFVSPSPMQSFRRLDSGIGTCWMKLCKSQIRGSITKLFPASSPVKMGSASALKGLVCSRQLEYDCDPNEWHLFIDSSPRSLIAVLLHNGYK